MMRRMFNAGVCVTLGVVAAASVGRAEFPRHVAKPRPLPGVPGYDYRPSEVRQVPTVTALSLPRVNLNPAAATLPGQPPRPAASVYQMSQTRLQVEHTFLSRAAVTLHENGEYQISFRADQNPTPADDTRAPLRINERLDVPLQTSQLKRNTFVVKVRGYAAIPEVPGRPTLLVATPAVIEFPPMEFIVQRGEPASKLYSGDRPTEAAVRKYFPVIDRIEVEFTYK